MVNSFVAEHYFKELEGTKQINIHFFLHLFYFLGVAVVP